MWVGSASYYSLGEEWGWRGGCGVKELETR